jgi:hypothetical protein
MSGLTHSIASFARANRKLAPAFALIIVLVSLLVARAAYNYHTAVLGEIAVSADRYAAFQSMLERADELRGLQEANERKLRDLEGGLLSADKPSIAAAKLQEAFKALVSKKKISVTSERALPAVYADRYARVPVEFQVKAGMSELKDLLYEVQASPVLMGVKSLRIKSTESGGPGSLDVTIVVEGAIVKPAGV